MKRRVTRKELMRLIDELLNSIAITRSSKKYAYGYGAALCDIANHFGVTVQRKEQP